ncbi:MAG: hypothetical protein AAB592_05865 [Patescibacteria group bacterium]
MTSEIKTMWPDDGEGGSKRPEMPNMPRVPDAVPDLIPVDEDLRRDEKRRREEIARIVPVEPVDDKGGRRPVRDLEDQAWDEISDVGKRRVVCAGSDRVGSTGNNGAVIYVPNGKLPDFIDTDVTDLPADPDDPVYRRGSVDNGAGARRRISSGTMDGVDRVLIRHGIPLGGPRRRWLDR